MSLHDLASHVQGAGRGEDKVLVHMTPGEVKGLQSLAMAHGGSLTINPQTGLPEAGFLSSLLPMAIGFGLAPFTGGLSAALITGAGYTAATGSLKKGIMAGLGAYGGAGLAGGLNAMGASSVNAANAANASATAAAQTPALNVASAGGVEGLKQNLYGAGQGVFSTMPAATGTAVPSALSMQGGQSAINLTAMQQNALAGTPRALPTEATISGATTVPTAPSISRPFTDYMSQVGQGAKNVYAGGTEGLKALGAAMPEYSITGGLLGTAGTYGIEKQEEAEEEMRRREANKNLGMIRPYTFDYGMANVSGEPYTGSAERTYFQPTYTAGTPYKAPGPEYAADGGLMGYAVGGPIEQMADMNAVGMNTGYPMANLQTPMYSNPAMQRPEATNVIAPSADAGVNAYTGEARFAGGGETQYGRPILGPHAGQMNSENQTRSQLAGGRRPSSTAPTAPLPEYLYDPKTMQFTQTVGGNSVTGGIATPAMQQIRQPTSPARPLIPNIDIPAYQTPEQQLGLGGFYDYMNQQMGGYAGYAAGGGVSTLGDYSDGGRLLKGPGDGVSDSIPASIGNRQPARLADGEFVVPARIVSEIGNGSTEAGARKLYAMMDRVQRARRKTTGKNQVAANTKAERLLPA